MNFDKWVTDKNTNYLRTIIRLQGHPLQTLIYPAAQV